MRERERERESSHVEDHQGNHASLILTKQDPSMADIASNMQLGAPLGGEGRGSSPSLRTTIRLNLTTPASRPLLPASPCDEILDGLRRSDRRDARRHRLLESVLHGHADLRVDAWPF